MLVSLTGRALIGMAGLTLAFQSTPLASEAQQPSKIPRIGVLGTGSPAEAAPRLEVFRQGLRDLGHVEGQNIAIEYRWAEGRVERFPDFAVELVGLKVDVIVARVPRPRAQGDESTAFSAENRSRCSPSERGVSSSRTDRLQGAER